MSSNDTNTSDDAETRYVFKSSYTLDDLRRGIIPPGALYSTLHDLGRERVVEAIPDIEQFLTDEDAQLRYVALEVLTLHFKLQHHWETACQFLEQDPDSDCRRMGASSLGILLRNTQDITTLRVLALIVRNTDENPFVRQAAYLAMREVIKFDPREQFSLFHGESNIDHDTNVDWAFVDSYLPHDGATPETTGE